MTAFLTYIKGTYAYINSPFLVPLQHAAPPHILFRFTTTPTSYIPAKNPPAQNVLNPTLTTLSTLIRLMTVTFRRLQHSFSVYA